MKTPPSVPVPRHVVRLPALKFFNVLRLQSLGGVIVKGDLPAIAAKKMQDNIGMILDPHIGLSKILDPLNPNGFLSP